MLQILCGRITKAKIVSDLRNTKKDKMPCYTMQLLVDDVSNSELDIMWCMLEEDVLEGGVELDDDEMR